MQVYACVHRHTHIHTYTHTHTQTVLAKDMLVKNESTDHKMLKHTKHHSQQQKRQKSKSSYRVLIKLITTDNSH